MKKLIFFIIIFTSCTNQFYKYRNETYKVIETTENVAFVRCMTCEKNTSIWFETKDSIVKDTIQLVYHRGYLRVRKSEVDRDQKYNNIVLKRNK